jgi:hypothetical protein
MIFSDARFFLIFCPLALIVIGIVRSFHSRLLVVLTIIVISFGFYMQWRASDFAVIIASIVVNFAIANPSPPAAVDEERTVRRA